MKKKIVVFTALIMCFVSVFAQNKIDKTTFEKLVDYANCQYLMAFIEENDAEKPYIKDTYEKNIKPVLQKATLDNLNSIPNFEAIEKLFPKGSNNNALELAGKINERKAKYGNSQNDNSLIESLGTTGWKGVDLTGAATRIQNSIRTKFNTVPTQKPVPVSEQEVVKNQTIQTSSQVDELQSKIDNLQQQYNALQNDSKIVSMQGTISTLRLLVIICLSVIVLFIVVLFLWYKSQFNTENRNSSIRKFVKNVFFTSEEIREKFNTQPTGGGNNKIVTFEEKLQELVQQFGELSEKVRNVQINSSQQAPQQTNNTPQPIPQNDNSIYFAAKSEKQLTEQLPNKANANFRVYAVSGNEAKFEYIGAVRNENWFENVCKITNPPSDNLAGKEQINTTQPGKVRKENNNWVVITPAEIKFI